MQDFLKFLTCGSVDDGKSTLIGRLLYDSKLLYTDQLQKLELDSQVGSREGKIDYSLLLDGLSAEREQGITIDVAYRFFNTEKRSFIVADTPGHEQYTRNMAVGASFADLAILLVDASKGMVTQTKRHTRINAMMGTKHFVLAINKMDLVEYSESVFKKISRDFENFVSEFDIKSLLVVPISATERDNIKFPSKRMPWYKGTTIFDYLETVEVSKPVFRHDFIMPVQRVSRPNHTFRGFQGLVSNGELKPSDIVTVFPSLETAKVSKVYNTDQEADVVKQGMAVTIQLDKEIDISRGDVLSTSKDLIVSDMFTSHLLWMDDQPLLEGKSYLLKLGTKTIPATLMKIKYKIDINDGTHVPSEVLYKNEIAVCDFVVSQKITFDTFENHPEMGRFILIDRLSHMTSAAGTILHDLRRGQNLFEYMTEVTPDSRAKIKHQNPKTIWFTGLSGSGKSTIANALEKALHARGLHTMLLDGDNIRKGLNQNLGFSHVDRIENIRRLAEVSKLMNDAGLIVITSFISPYEEDRFQAKEIIGHDNYIEVYISTPLDVCESRDVKGLYKKARNGEIPNFTGISSPYEVPSNPDIEINTDTLSPGASVEYILEKVIRELM